MVSKWNPIANIEGKPGDAAAMGRFSGIEAAITSMRPSLLSQAEDATYALPFSDKDGYTSGGVTQKGVFNFEKPPTVRGVEGTSFQPVDAPGYSYVFPDKDGYYSLAIRNDGTVEIFKGGQGVGKSALSIANDGAGMTRSDKSKIFVAGDSLSRGYFGGVPNQTSDSFPTKLQGMVPAGVSIINLATSGWTVDEVAVRIGAFPVALTLDGGQIPASGTVAATTTATIGWGVGERAYPGTLQGVQGTLTRPTGSAKGFHFVRTTAGTAVTVTPGTVFVPDQAGHSTESAVVFLGRNDVGQGVTGSDASVAAHIANGVTRIVDWLSRDIKQVLVVSVTTTTGERSGTSGYSTVTAANALLKDRYPTRFMDLRGYLVKQAIYDLGITPNAADLDNMAADTLPPSIMDPGASGTGDGTHYSKATAVLVATQVYQYLNTRDWISA